MIRDYEFSYKSQRQIELFFELPNKFETDPNQVELTKLA
jgi:hypothetical protein